MAFEVEERAIQKGGEEASRMKIGRFLNVQEVADELRLSVETVRRRIKAGKLRSFKEGGRVLVREADLDDYIQRQYGGPLSA
jgi:excisionase family DNA binding protein